MRFLITGALFAALLLGIFALATTPRKKDNEGEDELESKAFSSEFDFEELNESLADLTPEGDSEARKPKEKSFFDRVFLRLLDRATVAGHRFTPAGYIEKSETKLRHAGKRGPSQLDRFLAMRVLTIVGGVICGVLAAMVNKGSLSIGVSSHIGFSFFALISLFLLIGPDASLNREVETRRKEVQRSLPDILDLLTISVEAGLGFEQALQHIIDSIDGPLAEEFARMNAEMRAGSARADAMRALDERVGVDEISHFVMSMLQADKFGVSIGRVLRSQAEEMRLKRRQLAQEAAQKAPVKMLLPMTFFIFPPLFVVVLGPAMMNIATNFR